MLPALSATFPPSVFAEAGGRLDLGVLHARMRLLLPRPEAGLTTPFTETVLLIERLRVAEFPVQVERRFFTQSPQQYTQVLGVRLGPALFGARSCEPWEDFERWHAKRNTFHIHWLSYNPLPDMDLSEAMRDVESEYSRYRQATDWAIEEARRHGERHHLDENTRLATGQAGRSRL